MKKGYKECPFCANEIREGAKKCQYCHEFLDKELNNTDTVKWEIDSLGFNTVNQSTNSQKPRYKNWWIYIVILFFLRIIIYNINYNVKKKEAKDKISNYYDTVIQQNWDVSNVDSLELINAAKTAFDSKYAQDVFDKLSVIIDKYDKELNLIWDLYIEETSDLKNVPLLKEIVSNWKAYKSANLEYKQDYLNILNDLNEDGEEDERWKHIENFIDGMNKYADANIEYYSYVLSIQDDFFVDDDDILFYDWWDSMDKYNVLREKMNNESDAFDKIYSDYEKFMVDFAEKQKAKRK